MGKIELWTHYIIPLSCGILSTVVMSISIIRIRKYMFDDIRKKQRRMQREEREEMEMFDECKEGLLDIINEIENQSEDETEDRSGKKAV